MLVGLLLGVSIAYLAYKAQSLSISGFWAASLLGFVIFGLGGLGWAIVLIAFFISSSLLSRLFRKKKSTIDEKFSKGFQRDWAQVFANGGIAGLLVLFFFVIKQVNPQSESLRLLWYSFAASLAAATADTWATELGVLSHSRPISLRTFKMVDRGSSGAISLTGSLAAIGGAGFIMMLTVLSDQLGIGGAQSPGVETAAIYGVVWLAGVIGSLVDSALGASIQVLFYCAVCQKDTERYPFHLCGSTTEYQRGWRWMNNDWVNFLCVFSASIVALLFISPMK